METDMTSRLLGLALRLAVTTHLVLIFPFAAESVSCSRAHLLPC